MLASVSLEEDFLIDPDCNHETGGLPRPTF